MEAKYIFPIQNCGTEEEKVIILLAKINQSKKLLGSAGFPNLLTTNLRRFFE